MSTTFALMLFSVGWTAGAGEAKGAEAADLLAEIKACPCKIVYETFQDGNWELFMIAAAGSKPVNLTRTPKIHELYPKVSPDGTKVCFVVDEGEGKSKIRNLYMMNMDGTSRKLVAKNARQPCWKRDGKVIAYLRGEFEEFCYRDYATKGISFYDIETGRHRRHPNKKIHHLYNISWSPDGKWIVTTVHAGMGYKHGILAIEVDGMTVVNLGIHGCRPDFSPDGKRVAWGASDWVLRTADFDASDGVPKLKNKRTILTSKKPIKIYHIDWSPDGKFVTFSRGPNKKRLGMAPEIVGIKAKDWNICVADPKRFNRWMAVTSDGNCNKEPDWVPTGKAK